MPEEWKDEKTKPFNPKPDLTACDVALPEEEGVDVCNAIVSKRLGDFIESTPALSISFGISPWSSACSPSCA